MTYPHLQLVAGAHDRLGIRRHDDDWLDQAWADPSSRVLVVAGSKVRLEAGALAWTPTAEAPDGVRVLLGERQGLVWWAVLADRALADDDRDAWQPLRGLLGALQGAEEGEAALVFHAIGIAEWHLGTRFCPRCAGDLVSAGAGHELRCTGRCGRTQFPRSDPAVIMLVRHGEPGSPEEQCLLGRAPAWPEGRYSTLAGFCEPGESLEDTVRREVAEETGVRVGRVDYFGNQPWPLPASLMLGFVGEAETTDIELADHELADARWLTRAQMREEAEAGTLVLPGGVSISRSLVEHWYGGPLPGAW